MSYSKNSSFNPAARTIYIPYINPSQGILTMEYVKACFCCLHSTSQPWDALLERPGACAELPVDPQLHYSYSCRARAKSKHQPPLGTLDICGPFLSAE